MGSSRRVITIDGPAGAGKTSVIALITRAYDPQSGRVLIDGVEARQLPLAELRRAIGYVPQDIFLFSDTIRNNIALARLAAQWGLMDPTRAL